MVAIGECLQSLIQFSCRASLPWSWHINTALIYVCVCVHRLVWCEFRTLFEVIFYRHATHESPKTTQHRLLHMDIFHPGPKQIELQHSNISKFFHVVRITDFLSSELKPSSIHTYTYTTIPFTAKPSGLATYVPIYKHKIAYTPIYV